MEEVASLATVQDVRHLASIIRTQADTIDALITRLARVERLADGVKDAVLCVAQAVDEDSHLAMFKGTAMPAYPAACGYISAAQQPAPSATGEPVAIDAAAAVAAGKNADATETWLLHDDAPPPAPSDEVP